MIRRNWFANLNDFQEGYCDSIPQHNCERILLTTSLQESFIWLEGTKVKVKAIT